MPREVTMKKILAALALCGLLLTVPLIKVEQQDFLRIHVRADSNEQTDQQVKFAVKDEVEKLLSDKLQGADTKAEAMRRIEGALEDITQVCNATLDKNGKSYRASVAVKKETFPLRSYGAVALPAGEYDALIINLGSGEGDNWWCVAYPPLCFGGSGGGEIRYKSVLVELINRLRG